MKYPYSDLTEKIIGAAISVHKTLGPGYPEKIYQRALKEEFMRLELPFVRERKFDVYYNDKNVGYEIVDFCLFDKIIVELKSTKEILDIHAKQLVGYLRAGNFKLGLILNFGKSKLEIKRVII